MFSMRAYVLPSMNYFVRYLFAGERKFFIHFNGSILVLFFLRGEKFLDLLQLPFFSKPEKSKNKGLQKIAQTFKD